MHSNELDEGNGSNEIIIIDVSALTDDEMRELADGLRTGKRAIPMVPGWLAALGAMAAGGAIWWVILQLYLWRVGLL